MGAISHHCPAEYHDQLGGQVPEVGARDNYHGIQRKSDAAPQFADAVTTGPIPSVAHHLQIHHQRQAIPEQAKVGTHDYWCMHPSFFVHLPDDGCTRTTDEGHRMKKTCTDAHAILPFPLPSHPHQYPTPKQPPQTIGPTRLCPPQDLQLGQVV